VSITNKVENEISYKESKNLDPRKEILWRTFNGIYYQTSY